VDSHPLPAKEEVLDFLSRFRGAFSRRDQAHWAAVYLRGLLTAASRKTIEHIAHTAAELTPGQRDATAQALQHFLDRSPWDHDQLLRGLRAVLQPVRASSGVLVVSELAFLKQGRLSVGVQRQYSRCLGRKANCQLAIILFHTSHRGCFPLALRLYLPRDWQQDPLRLDVARVPESCRGPRSREDLATQLLAGLAGEQIPEGAVASALGTASDLPEAARAQGMEFLNEPDGQATAAVATCIEELRSLGLDHFKGRSWRGFHHHASLVVLAHAFRRWT
jgi:SRSO17 transposase